METRPLLFDLGRTKPTTRDVAALVKSGGVDALPDAQRRADDAKYQEIRCRSALNAVKGMPFKWTLNPYRGCTHGCHYCFARRYQSQLEMGAGDEFASVIFVKSNFVQVLQRELDKPEWAREQVALGTATDPYQPIEGHYKLSRGTLEALAAARTPVGIVTKGPMIVRDRDLLQELSKAAGCTVYLSVPCIDDEPWRALEPGTAHPLQRLKAVRALVDAGINAGVLMAPLVPGFSTQPSRMERTIKAVADHGARFVGSQVMFLQDGTRAHFMQFLQREYPDMVERIDQLYAAKRAPKDYQARVNEVFAMLKIRYGMNTRNQPAPSAGTCPPSQGAFTW